MLTTLSVPPTLAEPPGVVSGQLPMERSPALPEFSDQRSQNTPFVLPDLPEQLTPKGSPARHFTLQGVTFEGNTRFSDDELLALLAPWIGRSINIAELEEMRLALSRHYVDHGYINSGASLPDQRIENGIVRFAIIEGRLSDVAITGNERLNPEYIRSRLLADDQPILDTTVLQERFQQLLSDPLIDRLNGALRPGKAPGEATLDLEVTRALPYRLTLAADNHHSAASGSERVELDGAIYNLTGQGDRLSLLLDKSQGAWHGYGEFEYPINPLTRLALSFERNDSRIIEDPLRIGDIESEYQGIGILLSHDLIQRLDRRLSFGLGYALHESRTWLDGDPAPFSPGVEADGIARTRVLQLIQEYVQRDDQQVFTARSSFNLGLDHFQATVHPELPDGRYLSWLGQFRYARRLSEAGDLLLLSGGVQLSSDGLLPQERFSIGGASTLRGYRENLRVRDNGWFFSSELRHPLSEDRQGARWGSLTLAAFVDAGNAWNRRQHDWDDLLSAAGVGLLWQYRNLRANLYLARALNNVPRDSERNLQDDGVHFRLEVDIF